MKTKILYIVAILLLMAGSGLLVRMVDQGKIAFGSKNETEEIMQRLASMIELPGEIPTLATVEDKSKLEGQKFFENSENGDKLIIFKNSQLALLYRPANRKIIGFSNLLVSEDAKKSEGVREEVLKINVVVLNGSSKPGAAKKMADEVLSGVDNLEVVATGDAKGEYIETLVIDISGKYAEIAKGLAEVLEGKISGLPESEVKPNADILIIKGEN